MFRIASSTVWLCLLASISLYAQQDAPLPPVPNITGVGAAQQDDTPPPPRINPKTGLPYTPAELREMELDKYDPMKRNVDPTDDGNRLTDRENPAALPDQKKAPPLPGSIDAMNAAQADPAKASNSQDPDVASAEANGAEYSGPAVLSRSYTLARPMVPRQIQWSASGGFSYGWSTGQAPGADNGVTNYESVATQALGYTWTTAGRHIWKRDQMGLSYSGGYTGYIKGAESGSNHSLNLDYEHVVSRRISIQIVESLQDLSQNYSLENPELQPGNSIANINLASSPDVQLLNSQTLQSSTSVSMTFHQSTRLSYNASGAYFIIGRTEGVGMTGRQYSGDVNYRLTRKTTIGSYYSFTDYLYSHNISTSDSHGFGLIYSYAIDRRTQLQSRIGITRIESLAYSTVPLPLELEEILGQGAVVVNSYSLRRTSDISVQLVRDFRRSRTASLAFAHGQSPGNGVLLTSIQQTLSGGFTASLLRRKLPVSIGVSYSTVTSSLQGSIGFYKSENAYVSVSHLLRAGATGSITVNYLRYNVSGSPLKEDSLRVSVGVSWNAPERFLRKL